VLGFIVLAILYGSITLLTNRSFVLPRKWMNLLFPILAVLGLGVAAYIAYVQLLQVQAFCGPLENCNSVLQSRYAKLMGFAPNSVLGSISYLALLFLWIRQKTQQDWLSLQAPLLIVAITLLGSLLSTYLTVLQVFVLKALCMWCLSSGVLITLLYLLGISNYQTASSAIPQGNASPLQ
jgi:uncharacterized membrane protein